MLGLWLLFVFPRISGFNAIPRFMLEWGTTRLFAKVHLRVFLVTFERTTTFSQLSHDGRTAVERDKNARKIVA